MTGIAEMFAELDGHDRLDRAIEEWGARWAAYHAAYRAQPRQRHLAAERTRRWKQSHPERARELAREQGKRDRQRARMDPTFGVAYREKRRLAAKRYRDKHKQRLRDVWRKRQAAYRARKAA